MNKLAQVRDLALELAMTELVAGVKEETKNWSPRIAQYLASVGIVRPAPWCCAAVIHCYDRACAEFQMPLVLPRTGKVVRLWQRTPERYLIDQPAPGRLFLHAEDPDDPDSDGHIGWVVKRLAGDAIATVEANTNALGSREGDRWAEKIRSDAYINLGYIDIGLEIPGAD